jgi:hypothetical protein
VVANGVCAIRQQVDGFCHFVSPAEGFENNNIVWITSNDSV